MKVTLLNSLVVGFLLLTSACAKKEDSPASELPAPEPTRAAPSARTEPAVAAEPAAPAAPAVTAVPDKPVVEVTELKKEDIKVGTGAVAETGKAVSVHYTGWLTNGTKFDSSKDRGQPFNFQLGGGQVIKGWDQGVVGMKVGGVRKLTIPPDLGYGARGAGGVIPPNATLVFEVELLGVN